MLTINPKNLQDSLLSDGLIAQGFAAQRNRFYNTRFDINRSPKNEKARYALLMQLAHYANLEPSLDQSINPAAIQKMLLASQYGNVVLMGAVLHFALRLSPDHLGRIALLKQLGIPSGTLPDPLLPERDQKGMLTAYLTQLTSHAALLVEVNKDSAVAGELTQEKLIEEVNDHLAAIEAKLTSAPKPTPAGEESEEDLLSEAQQEKNEQVVAVAAQEAQKNSTLAPTQGWSQSLRNFFGFVSGWNTPAAPVTAPTNQATPTPPSPGQRRA